MEHKCICIESKFNTDSNIYVFCMLMIETFVYERQNLASILISKGLRKGSYWVRSPPPSSPPLPLHVLSDERLTVTRTTDNIFYQYTTYMFISADKETFEKHRNAILNDFHANWRKISMIQKIIFSKSTCHFSLPSIRYITHNRSIDFKVFI